MTCETVVRDRVLIERVTEKATDVVIEEQVFESVVVSEDGAIDVVEVLGETRVIETSRDVAIIEVGGRQGVPGPPGPAGGPDVQRAAGEPMSALRVVYESEGDVFLLDPTISAEVHALLGITTMAAGSAGATVSVRTLGSIDDAGWNWSEGLVFAGPNGTLTQTPPSSGWEIVIGYAPSPTRLNLTLDEPVLLA